MERDLHYGIGRIRIRLPIITGRLGRVRYSEGHFVRRRWVDEVGRPSR